MEVSALSCSRKTIQTSHFVLVHSKKPSFRHQKTYSYAPGHRPVNRRPFRPRRPPCCDPRLHGVSWSRVDGKPKMGSMIFQDRPLIGRRLRHGTQRHRKNLLQTFERPFVRSDGVDPKQILVLELIYVDLVQVDRPICSCRVRKGSPLRANRPPMSLAERNNGSKTAIGPHGDAWRAKVRLWPIPDIRRAMKVDTPPQAR
jgi:hypothetical protein